jgi:hypothetical protein
MIYCFGSSADEAAEVAKGWTGFGPNIYVTRREDWKRLIGEDQRRGLYFMLVSMRDEKGACPKNIVLYHGGGRHGPEKDKTPK